MRHSAGTFHFALTSRPTPAALVLPRGGAQRLRRAAMNDGAFLTNATASIAGGPTLCRVRPLSRGQAQRAAPRLGRRSTGIRRPHPRKVHPPALRLAGAQCTRGAPTGCHPCASERWWWPSGMRVIAMPPWVYFAPGALPRLSTRMTLLIPRYCHVACGLHCTPLRCGGSSDLAPTPPAVTCSPAQPSSPAPSN
jgi:hypothetical protein